MAPICGFFNVVALCATSLLQFYHVTAFRHKINVGKKAGAKVTPAHPTRKRIETDKRVRGRDAVMYFDAQNINNVVITRQHARVFHGSNLSYEFQSRQLHKEFVVETQAKENSATCEQPVFVKRSGFNLCSTGLFTRKRMNCDTWKKGQRTLQQRASKQVDGLEPPTDRGFGLEFEFVARELTEDVQNEVLNRLADETSDEEGHMSLRSRDIDAVVEAILEMNDEDDEWLANDYEYDYYLIEIGEDEDDGTDVLGVKACFENITRYIGRGGKSHQASNLQRWNWEYDGSVVPLSDQERLELGAHPSEARGVAFEVTSPGPPHVLSGNAGFQSFNSMLYLLKRMGIQAGPSQGLHVHVNVQSNDAPGESLTHAQIAYVWAAYAKYQLVIDEMFSPSRPSNAYANRLFLGTCPEIAAGKCDSFPCGCVRKVFNQLHSWLQSGRNGSNLDFCNSVLGTPGYRNPCGEQYPHQRYFQVNLVPLYKFGTIEFRAHSATYDQERIARWVQFLIAFVEHFGRGQGSAHMKDFFNGSSAKIDYEKLRHSQRSATFDDLFRDLSHLVNAGSASYFRSRSWERNDASCNLGGLVVERPDCSHGANAFAGRRVGHITSQSEGRGADRQHSRGRWQGRLRARRHARRHHRHRRRDTGRRTGRRGARRVGRRAGRRAGSETTANASQRHGSFVTLHVAVPEGLAANSYLEVEMPEGNIRAILLDAAAIERGFFDIRYRPVASDLWQSRLRNRLIEN